MKNMQMTRGESNYGIGKGGCSGAECQGINRSGIRGDVMMRNMLMTENEERRRIKVEVRRVTTLNVRSFVRR